MFVLVNEKLANQKLATSSGVISVDGNGSVKIESHVLASILVKSGFKQVDEDGDFLPVPPKQVEGVRPFVQAKPDGTNDEEPVRQKRKYTRRKPLVKKPKKVEEIVEEVETEEEVEESPVPVKASPSEKGERRWQRSE